MDTAVPMQHYCMMTGKQVWLCSGTTLLMPCYDPIIDAEPQRVPSKPRMEKLYFTSLYFSPFIFTSVKESRLHHLVTKLECKFPVPFPFLSPTVLCTGLLLKGLFVEFYQLPNK